VNVDRTATGPAGGIVCAATDGATPRRRSRRASLHAHVGIAALPAAVVSASTRTGPMIANGVKRRMVPLVLL